MSREPFIIVNEIGKAVANASAVLNVNINYQFGLPEQMIKLLQLNKMGVPQKSNYPLIAVFCDFPEKMGTGFDSVPTIKKIAIATITQLADLPVTRVNKTFIPILYPIYYEFLNQLARLKTTVINDPMRITHTKSDIYGVAVPIGKEFTDYLDIIEITNISLPFKQAITC